MWERLWNRFWPTVLALCICAGLALLDVPFLFGAGWHLFILSLFAAALAATFLLTGAPFTWPRRADVERHIEAVNALDHRPLAVLKDTPVDGLSGGALYLWQKHIEQAAKNLPFLRIYRPQTNIRRKDRWALRYIAVFLLVAGLVVARDDAALRLRGTLTPDFGSLIEKDTLALDLWITPPAYTQEATTYLATARQGLVPHNGAVRVPDGSTLKLRLSGLRFAPWLNYAGETHKTAAADAESFTLEMPLHTSGTLELRSWFKRLGAWPLNVEPDQPPAVNLSQITPTARGTIKINYTAQDDHGITKLTGIVSASGDAFRFDIPSSSASNAVYTQDVAASPAAGTPATLTLEAEDGAGNKSTSAPVSFVMPERTFHNPLAQRLIQERRTLLSLKDPGPTNANIARTIAGIAEQPGLYKDNTVIFLALSTAARRLFHDDSVEMSRSVARLLWDIALKLDDGGLSIAQRELSSSLQQLAQALNDKNMPKEQLQALLDEVKQKMQQYMQSLAGEMQQRMSAGKTPQLSPELTQKFMNNLDINKLLDQMRQLSQASSRGDLQKMARSLQDSIDNIDMGQMDQMQERQAQAMEALQNLDDIIHRQQSLYDKTNKTSDPADLWDQSREQAAIRTELGNALRKLSESGAPMPDNFAKADQAMKQSGDALGKGRPQQSLPQQKTALEQLQQGLDGSIRQMADAMQQSLFSFGLGQIGNFGEGFDPLGRPRSAHDDDSVKIPDEKERRRVQQIIDELRHRSNEPNRTKVERDYIDRLLDQF